MMADYPQPRTPRLAALLDIAALRGGSITYDVPHAEYTISAVGRAWYKHSPDSIRDEKTKYYAFIADTEAGLRDFANLLGIPDYADSSDQMVLLGPEKFRDVPTSVP